MQEKNNNFNSIICAWRERLGEPRGQSLNVSSMSGDSPDASLLKDAQLDSHVNRYDNPAMTSGLAITAVADKSINESDNPEKPAKEEEDHHTSKSIIPTNVEKRDFKTQTDDDEKGSYLEDSGDSANPTSDTSTDIGSKTGDNPDKTDSVYLHRPPAHKINSNRTNNEDEEDCALKCLYYFIQCCDCVIS